MSTEPTTNDPLLTPQEAAARLHVLPETIRVWCRKGAMAYERVGLGARGRIRIRESELRRHITSVPSANS